MRRPMLFLSLCLSLVAPLSHLHAQEPTESAEAETEEQTPEQAKPPTQTDVTLSRSERQEQALHRRLPAAQLRQLESGDDAFLGLFLPAAQPKPRGGVLLIADRNEHADWPELIGPARRQLSSEGWHTLAITLPSIPRADPTLDEAALTEVTAEAVERTTQRINIAAKALQAEGVETLILLGRGEGAFWALNATASDARPRTEAAALILLQSRPPAHIEDGQERVQGLLAQWQNPVYEIFSGGGEAVRQRAQDHELNAQREGHGGYRLLLIPKPDHSDLGQRVLVKRLQGWIRKHVPDQ